LALSTAAALACRGPPPCTVERVTLAESLESERLESAGVSRDALRLAAARLLDGAPGFVAPAQAGRKARRFIGIVQVHQVDALASGPSGVAVAHVVLGLELAPVGGEPSLREIARGAESVGPESGALRNALERAATTALERAVASFATRLAEEGKSSRDLVADLSSRDARVRAHAVRVLGERGDRDAVPDVVKCLRDSDPEIVERAVGALARLRDPRAVPALIELTHRREGPYVANMARILGDIGGADAQAWLLTMASGHPDEVVRGAAREALSEMAARVPRAQVKR
jgi:hypothetical protein